MKKIVIKNITAFITASAIVTQMLPLTVGAKSFKQGRIAIEEFNTFSEYTVSKDLENKHILPEGFKISADGTSNGFIAYKDSETGTNAFGLNWLSKPVYAFPEVIKSGKLHVSFDVKTSNNSPDTTSTPSLWIRTHQIGVDTTHNVDDYYYHLDQNGNEKDSQKYVVGEKMITLLHIKKNDIRHYSLGTGHGTAVSLVTGGLISVSDGTVKGDGMVGDGSWHKVSMQFDFDRKTVAVTYDGITVYENMENSGIEGIKDIFLLDDNNGLVAVDNWYVNHYFEDADNNAVMYDEYDEASKSMMITFSEHVTRDLTADDFIVKSGDNRTVTPKSITNYANSAVKLTFDDLDDGVYTIKCAQSFLAGERKPENEVKFTVSENVHNATDRKYFINEGFDNYAGGMPYGWYSLTDDIEASKLTKSLRDADNALKISSNNPIAYAFDGALMNGIYNIEFDVKNGSGWYMHLLDTAMTSDEWCKDNSADWVYQDDYNKMYEEYKTAQGTSYTDSGWDTYIKDSAQNNKREAALKETKKNTVVIGQDTSGIKWNKGRKKDLSDAELLSAAVSDEWTTVKIRLDFNNGSYYYTIGDNAEKEVTFASLKTAIDGSVDQSGTLRYDRIALINRNTAFREFVHGIGGIAFTSVGDKPLEIDNIKVYDCDSYNFYEDFNTVQANGIIRRTVQPGWYNILMEGYGKYAYKDVNSKSYRNIGIGGIDAVGGNNANALDGTAAELISTAGPITGLFEKPIKLGKNFTIELDWRNTGSNTLYLGVINRANMYSRAENTKNSETGHPATGETPAGRDALYKYPAILRVCPLGFSYWRPHDSSALSSSTATVTNKKLLDAVSPGIWHIKYNVKTNETGFEYQIEVTSKDDDTEYYITDWVKQDKMFTYTMDDIVGITLGGSGSYVDNIKVYENRKASVLSYTAVYEGEETEISDTVRDTLDAVKITFSSELLNADGISIKHSDGTDVLCEKQLSEDKKSAILIFKENVKQGDKISVAVSADTKFSDYQYNGSLSEISKLFSVLKAPVGILINEFRVYEKLGGNQLYFNYHATDRPDDLRTIPEGWYPVISDALTKKKFSNLNLELKGYNYGDKTDLTVVFAGYDSAATILEQSIRTNIFVEKGEIDLTVDFPEFTNSDVKRIKVFLWDKDTYGPRTEEIDYMY